MADDDPYRDAAHGHSSTLERLAGRHPAALEIEEVAGRKPSEELLGDMLHMPAPGQASVTLAWLALIAGALLRWIGWIEVRLIVVTGPAVLVAYLAKALRRRGWRRRVAKRLAWIDQQPFPITGFDGFLMAMRPMLDITFRKPPTVAALTAGVQSHLPGAEVIAIDDHTLRIIAPMRSFQDEDAMPPATPLVTAFSDDVWLRRFVDDVLRPVHNELGVERLHLGGRQSQDADEIVSDAVSDDPRDDASN